MDWKFWVGDVAIPIVTFVLGLFIGKTAERRANAKINGDNNSVIQNSKVEK